MAELIDIINYMINYEKGCAKRVNHFLKVHSFAKIIAENEKVDKETSFLIEVVSILHDIGIRASLEKYNSSSGKYQQIEGPALAEKVLKEKGFEKDFIDRICFLIAHHHEYDNIDGIDYQILIEADFLVNIFEDDLNRDNILNIKKHFKTKAGIELLEIMFLSDDTLKTKKPTAKKKKKIDISNMGVNIDKNEYREIVLSQSNHPEKMNWGKYN